MFFIQILSLFLQINFLNMFLDFLIISNLIFFLGLFGVILNQRNFSLSMLFIEVMYIGIFVHFIFCSLVNNLPIGQLYALALLVVIACESVIGLGILLVLYRYDKTINIYRFTELRG